MNPKKFIQTVVKKVLIKDFKMTEDIADKAIALRLARLEPVEYEIDRKLSESFDMDSLLKLSRMTVNFLFFKDDELDDEGSIVYEHRSKVLFELWGLWVTLNPIFISRFDVKLLQRMVAETIVFNCATDYVKEVHSQWCGPARIDSVLKPAWNFERLVLKTKKKRDDEDKKFKF